MGAALDVGTVAGTTFLGLEYRDCTYVLVLLCAPRNWDVQGNVRRPRGCQLIGDWCRRGLLR